MYHHHSQQQGPPPFSNGPRPPHHQQPPNQHQNRPPSNMLSQVMGFQFPRPTQLPDELESALAIRGARDIDHRLIDHINRPNQHQNKGSGSGISQHGSYGSNPISLTSDNQPGRQQGVDWSGYQPPSKLFASPPPSANHQSQQQQGLQQQQQSSHAGMSIPSWTAPVSDSPSPQARHPNAGGSGGSGDGQALYTPESAGSILASFGLSNEDLEVLSHYPDDQLTPDTLPFILRDIQINKSGNQKTVASTSSSSFSRSIHDMPLPPSRSSPLTRSRSPEVLSLLTVTQTAGKVIDYGHASRAKAETSTRETFKRERLSNERTVKMYPSSSSTPKLDKVEMRQVLLEHSDSSKHGDRDYRRTSSDHHKSTRNLDRDYRHDGPKPRPSSEAKSDASLRRSLSSSSGSRPHSSNKKLPTPTMISDFSAVSPKVYPHTCSLCHTQCDQEKEWVEHINTVNHTAACRDLRNKYPGWKPNLPSRSGRYGSRALWDPKTQSSSHSVSQSLSGSPTPSPPRSKHRVGPYPYRPHTGPYSPHNQLRHHHYAGGSSRSGVTRPHDTNKFSTGASRHPSSSKAGHNSKHGPLQYFTKTIKSGTKPGTKTTRTSTKLPLHKKKKKIVPPASQDSSVADRLVYLTGIPKDASEQEVTDVVGSFGKINNVILMPCSEEESQKGEGQKASVCMIKAECAQAMASSTNLFIRGQQITASIAKKPEAGESFDANYSKLTPAQDKYAARKDSGGEADHKTSDEGMVLVTGLPESGWSESDLIKLVQPFGTPSDIIMATQIGKVLVSLPDMEIAQEIVKVHAFIPAKIQDSELKMIYLKQRIGLSTPVALYNLLMGSVDPLESSVPVGWSCLLVISNVPNTPSGSSEVQKLVRRFGTVIKTLVLNNTVICEMATAAMALSVYKRFQTFPCIIQNNPLFFSRKPDPKANIRTKVISTFLDSSEDTPATGKGSQAAAADKAETAPQESSKCLLEGVETDNDWKDEKTMSTMTVGEDKALGENRSQDDVIKKEELTAAVSDSLAALDAEREAELEAHIKEGSAVETVMETAEENKDVYASVADNDEIPAGEETKTPSSDGDVASQEAGIPELPKVTQEMVNALLVECRTRTLSHSNNTAAPTNGEKGGTQIETEQSDTATKETKEPPQNNMEEEVKKQDRELKEREARKEKEARERERKEKERRDWEKEERTKRERERNERARRERRDRERRERKRAYNEDLSGSRSSSRSDGYKQSSWRDEPRHNSEVETEMVEEEFDDFPFNLSDFVTVDEVGDVNDLPSSPSTSVPMKTTEGGEDAPTSVKQETPGDTHKVSDASATVVECDEHASESEPVTVSTAETSDVLESSTLTVTTAASLATSQVDFSPSQMHVPTCQTEAPKTKITPETEAALTTILDSTTEVELLPAPAASAAPAGFSSNSLATGVGTSNGKKEENEENALNQSQDKEEMVSVKTEEVEKKWDKKDEETEAPSVETGSHKRSEDQANSEEESVKKKFRTDTPTDLSFTHFDPSSPVGMEYLVPKTGFFCKVCNRFFSGAKEAETNHCKTLKHYENLQKYLKTTNPANVLANPDST
ncbi:zinc finger protein 638-like isoform X2 [Clinocottus analis]|uniref:zinc finger protein 638-like isoform X2 n=1 Tax=Clinocottus analis TaxID=304258 RepID=UPI0035C21DF4